MTHDGHLVQRRLTVEENDIAVHHVSLDLVPVLETLLARLFQESKIETLTILTNDVARASLTRRWVRSVVNELLKSFYVVRRHRLRIRHVERDGPRNSEFIQHEVRIGRNDGTRREIDALTHQVTSDATSLTLETL